MVYTAVIAVTDALVLRWAIIFGRHSSNFLVLHNFLAPASGFLVSNPDVLGLGRQNPYYSPPDRTS